MDVQEIRLRPGRTWRLNPHYRRQLAGFPSDGVLDASEVDILDVLSVEVDGVNLTAGVPEDRIFRVVSDLAAAAERLASGRPKASLTVGPVELLFTRSGSSVLLSLIELGPPPVVRVQDLDVEAARLFAAVLACVESLYADLREVAPALARGALGRGLTRSARRLRRHRRPAELIAEPRGVPRALPVPRSRRRGLSCGFELADDGDQLATYSGSEGDLHSLLAAGRIQIHGPAGEPLAEWQGPPFLALRALVPEVRELIAAFRSGDRSASLHFGQTKLEIDLTDRRLTAGGTTVDCAPLEVASVLLGATLDFCAAVVSRAPVQARNSYLVDLRTDAEEAYASCRELQAGDLTARSAARHPAKGNLDAPPVSAAPLAPWRVRRLTFRRRWNFDAGPLLPAGVGRLGRRLLVLGEDGAFALDRTTGIPEWRTDPVDAAWLGPHRSDPALFATRQDLDLVTPGGSTAWSLPIDGRVTEGLGRYLRGAGHLLVSLDGRTITALRECDGSVAWRFAPPEAATTRICGGPGGVVAATDTGLLYGLDPSSGRVRWRVRTTTAGSAGPLPLGHWIVLGGESAAGHEVSVVDARTGSCLRTHVLALDDAAAPVLFGGRIHIAGEVGGDSAVCVVRVGDSDRVSRLLLTGLSGVPAVRPQRGRLLAADRDGNLVAVNGEGQELWRASLAHRGERAPTLLVGGGIAVVASRALEAFDPESGERLGATPTQRWFGAPMVLADEGLNLFVAEDEGTVQAWQVGTHLSVVGE